MVIWLTGIPGVGKRHLANALKVLLQNGKRIQVLDAAEVKAWVNPTTHTGDEERVDIVAWVARMLVLNDIGVIVCCVSSKREQRISLRHRFHDEKIPFHEVWVDGETSTEEIEKSIGYERPNPPDYRAVVKSYDGWGELARQVAMALDL